MKNLPVSEIAPTALAAPSGSVSLMPETQPRITVVDDPKLFELSADPLLVASNLFDDFVVPPFSVLDTRQGYWQERCRQWIGLGIRSEIGREGNLTYGAFQNDNFSVKDTWKDGATSIFDPVLCEIIYRWFSPRDGVVLDPFAGGSVRGVIATALGRSYTGIELRAEQVEANREQARRIFANHKVEPAWIVGDSAEVLREANDIPPADLLFSCHPAGTSITTKRGLFPIEQLVVDDIVLTHRGQWQPVTECLAFEYEGDMAEISRQFSNLPLRATRDHPLLVRRDGEIHWRCAGDVSVGDELVEPRPQLPDEPLDGQPAWRYEIPDQIPGKRGRVGARVGNHVIIASREAARLMGYYMAEGSWSGGGVNFAFGPDEDDYITDVLDLIPKVTGLKSVERPQAPDNRVRTLGASGVIGCQFFGEAGSGAANKHFPEWLWECSNELLAEAVCGVWRGDGWHEAADGDMGFGSVSRQLAEDIRRALLRLGIVASLSRQIRSANTYGDKPLPMWRLAVRGVHADDLAKIVGAEIVTPPNRRPGRAPELTETHVFYRVEGNQRFFTESPTRVYNLEVQDDHSYLAEGVASHNCPPYADLEVYSDDPHDLSNMPPDEFDATYTEILGSAAGHLKDDRFGVLVVGNLRDGNGHLRDLARLTIGGMEAGGCALYNEIVLVNAVGTGAVRARKQMVASRKIVKMHQTVLVFVKGDPKVAAEALGPIGTETLSVAA